MPDSSSRNRRPPPQINPFRAFVNKELIERRQTYPTPTWTPFARMASCLYEPELNYRYFTIGLSGWDGPDNIFELSYGSDREYIGYAYRDGQRSLIAADEITRRDFDEVFEEYDERAQRETDRAISTLQGLLDQDNIPAGGGHPMPGVESIEVERFVDGAGTRAIVSWAAYNPMQLEFLRHHFMVPDTIVVLDWGHMRSDNQPNQMLDFSSGSIDGELAHCFSDRAYIVENYCRPNQGNYDLLVGNVYNFDINYDSRNQVYHCTTHIVSTGEYIFGFSGANTAVVPDDSTLSSTIVDFFKEGQDFDSLITSLKAEVETVETYQGRPAMATGDFVQIMASADAPEFISWEFFSTGLMNALATKLRQGSEVFDSKIYTLLNFGEPPEDFYSTDLYVGNNEYLKSTTPEVMVLANKYMDNIHDIFAPFPKFGDSSDRSDRAVLSEGVWLNVEMIRKIFLESEDIERAITSILDSMNKAVANYWDLSLYFDDNLNRYVVIDRKFTQSEVHEIEEDEDPEIAEYSRFYKFNKDVRGETLELTMDSAYPPSVVAQMGITAKVSQSPSEYKDFLERYPSMSNSGFFSLVLNWSNLESTIGGHINALSSSRGRVADVEYEQQKTDQFEEKDEVSSHFRIADFSNTFGRSNRGDAEPAKSDGPSGAFSPRAARSFLEAIGNPVEERFEGLEATQEENDRSRESLESRYLSELTIEEVRAAQKDNGGLLFAVGKYQLIPDTLAEALNWADREGRISRGAWDTVKFNAITQEVLADYLFIGGKRRNLERYIKGESNNLIDAERDLAQEFASMPYSGNNGRSYYNDGANRAHTTLAEAHAQLRRARQEYADTGRVDSLREFVAQYESGSGGINAYNLGTEPDGNGRQRFLGAPSVGSEEYFKIINASLNRESEIELDDVDLPERSDAQIEARMREIQNESEQRVSLEQMDKEEKARQEAREKRIAEQVERAREIRDYFGHGIVPMIALNESRMVKQISKNGIENHGSLTNGFVAPFPTTTTIDIRFPGVSGIAMFDGFTVDKLPYVYDLYGIFQATSVTESIASESGWTTGLTGIFRMLYFDPVFGQKLRDNTL